ncbi:MAG: NAD(P)-dependent oxidoreductase [Xanthomonadales bacterium]|nr:NAD(P)-dependent oxidoreductase [Xanthomonadales bacterium]NNL94719.1 NAD(P)-dependent oxidoreductase [Xanthomonadales bacterium]
MNQQIKAGVIGLGAMGAPMALNLARKKLLQSVWNRSPGPARSVAAETGVSVASSPAHLARQCPVVLTCVSADSDLLEVIEQLLPGLQAGSVVLDTSTVSPATAQRANDSIQRAGGSFVDAPVSGGVEGAIHGRLSVMAGGDPADIERIRPVLEAISASVTHMGPVGSGQATKAVNQVIVGGIAEAVCEALALGEKLNLPSERLLQVLGAGAAGSWFLEHRGQSMLEDRFEKGFKLSLLLKDLRIIKSLARELDISMRVVEQAIDDYQELVDAGYGDNDISGLISLKRKPATEAG